MLGVGPGRDIGPQFVQGQPHVNLGFAPHATDILDQILHQADFTIPVEIEGNYHNVYVIKRPGVDEFMKRVGELYEVVVFTASVSKVSLPPSDRTQTREC